MSESMPTETTTKVRKMKRKTREDLPLGRLAKDTLSGFTGVIECRAEWLNGCFRITLAPNRVGKDGEMLKGACFDAEQIALLPEQAHEEKPDEQKTNGPMPDTPRQGE